MICQNCGKNNKENAMFCIQCGSPLGHGDQRIQNMPSQIGQPAAYRPAPPPKKKTGLIIGITVGIIAIILIAISAIIIAKKGWSGKESDNNNTVSEQQQDQSQSPGIIIEDPNNQQAQVQPDQGVQVPATTEAPQPATTQPPLPPTPQTPEQPPSTQPPAYYNTGQSGDYILPYSASTVLTEADLVNLSREDLRLARNEIYARHGRKFKDQGLQNYFLGKSWYQPTIEPSDFDAHEESYLSEVEKKNKDTIYLYEKKMGFVN